ncbi:MAG: glycosyltransferase [Eubacterium sp.]|nr:glycosyltransferase [Eubacterium sp.]
MRFPSLLKRPGVSVIIPVYNVEKYLKQCLDSIAAQTFKDYELICVDDGSTDSSPEILKGYAARDSRIKVILQDNQSCGTARNNGLKVAKGKYVIWLDSDDFFEPTMLEETYNRAVETDADIVLFAFRNFDNVSGSYYNKRGLFKEAFGDLTVFSMKEIPDTILQVTLPNVWTKLYKRKFILKNGLRYQTLPNCEDVYFTFLALCCAGRISYVDKALLSYRINRQDNNESKKFMYPLCCIEADTELFDELNRRGFYSSVKTSYANHILEHYNYVFWRFRNDNDALEAVKKELKESFLPYTRVLEEADEVYYDMNILKRLREL